MTRLPLLIAAILMVLFQVAWFSVIRADSTADLIKKLSSQNVMDRRDAARQLGKLRDPESILSLIRVLKDPEPMVRLDASGALIEIGSPVVEPLIEALKGETHTAFFWNAIRILDVLGDPRAIGPLNEIVKTNPDPNIQQIARSTVERLQRANQPK